MLRIDFGYAALFFLSFSFGICGAQTLGYVQGADVYGFNPSTGAIVTTVPGIENVAPFAVAPDDVTLYLPTGLNALDVVSGQTGQTIGVIDVSIGSNGVVLTKDGSTAYTWSAFAPMIPGGLAIVNTSTLSVTSVVTTAGIVNDVALSPDDSTLYVSVHCGGADCKSTNGNCPVAKGICAFDRSTLALKWTVPNVNGAMAASLDGASLYVTNQPDAAINSVYVVNTATQAVSRFGVFQGTQISRVAIDPVSHYGVFVDNASQAPQSTETAFLLNTSTNQLVEKLFSNAPGYGTVVSPGSGPVFAPDGKSLWMLLSCSDQVPQCTLPSGVTLVGISFPSGALISETPVDMYAAYIAFPR